MVAIRYDDKKVCSERFVDSDPILVVRHVTLTGRTILGDRSPHQWQRKIMAETEQSCFETAKQRGTRNYAAKGLNKKSGRCRLWADITKPAKTEFLPKIAPACCEGRMWYRLMDVCLQRYDMPKIAAAGRLMKTRLPSGSGHYKVWWR